ncbi:hypothetical protein Ancab_021171 [Ancistrocladus abbreviatus]
MGLMVLAMQSCAKQCFSERCLRSAVVFEVGGSYQNALGRKMRSDKIFVSKISRLSSRSKHKFAKKLPEDLDSYCVANLSFKPKWLNKVLYVMGDDKFCDSVWKRTDQKECSLNPKGVEDDFDISLACRRFPSITLGGSPLVELYDSSVWHNRMGNYSLDRGGEESAPSPINGNWIADDGLSELWHCLYTNLPSLRSSTTEEIGSSDLRSQPQFHAVVADQDLGLSIPVEENSACMVVEKATTIELILDKPVSCISRLKKNLCRQLEDSGIHTLRKLLHHFPRSYADLQNPHVGIEDGQYLIFAGRIISSRGVRASYSLSFLEVIVEGEVGCHESTSESNMDDVVCGRKKTINLHLKKFLRGARFTSRPFLVNLQQKHKVGDMVCVSGKVRSMPSENHYEMREYRLDVIQDEHDSSVCVKERPYPIYPSKSGIKPDFFVDIITRALRLLPANIDPIPHDILEDFGLLHLRDAYIGIHQPNDLNEADLARRRFIFDEFFYLQLGRLYQMLEGLGSRIEKEGLLEKYRNPQLPAVSSDDWCTLAKRFLKALPYSLTSSQLSAVSEIIWDLRRPVPMNRLLQGDVGCGKTIVAFLACVEVLGSGYQAAFMVPTELLAAQHYEHLIKLLDSMESDFKSSIALLTGSTPSKEARLIRQGLQAGDISLVIGTHSLIAEKVEFSALRLAVIDEQHRFGVIQRGRFNSKLHYTSSSMDSVCSSGASKGGPQMAPHVLAMSATPIPRTLALALYGDMSLTQITDLPPGRTPIETHILEGNEIGFETVYRMMFDELVGGGKVYLVYPIIEQSEQLPQLRAASADFETICMRFPGYSCSLLHGKLKSDEKDEALRRFRDGRTHILLSTQVIEIGVDVPDASMMVVMNAERFGMAQLHQLRGRVGRGARKSKCILLGSTSSSLGRLKVLENSSDGFHLAKVDLLLRGPGDLLGKKQSGHLPEFPVARLEIDGNILQEAHVAALRILGTSHDLERFPELKAELSMRQPLSILGD